MKVYCNSGHEYDNDNHTACPICATGQGLAASNPTKYEGDEGPVPDGHKIPPLQPMPQWPNQSPPKNVGNQPLAPFNPGHQVTPGGTVYEGDDEAAERLMGFLVVTASKEDEEHRYVRLRKGVNQIGRFGTRCGIELRDREVSGLHALVICTNSATRLVDLDSANGVFVDGERTEIALLEEGSCVTFGRTDFVYVPFPFVADD